jgi:Zn-dependent M28 family amino/carboxypeptidase
MKPKPKFTIFEAIMADQPEPRIASDETNQHLRAHVHELAGRIGERNVFRSPALHAAEDYIRRQWQTLDYEVETQPYEVQNTACANLEITLPGTELADEIILIGAHYDTVRGSPGADDNASGVAALLELSRLLRNSPRRRSLRFVAFVNEEPPFFLTRKQGSMRYARQARRRRDNIRFMISLEMLGYYRSEPGSQKYPPLFRHFFPNRGDFIGFVSNLRSRKIMRRLVGAFKASSDFPAEHLATFAWVPGVSLSDHLPFWLQRYRALMITDTAFYRNPYYHTAMDTPKTLDYERFAAVTRGLVEALRSVADEP